MNRFANGLLCVLLIVSASGCEGEGQQLIVDPPLLEPGGRLLVMKGRRPEQELADLGLAADACRLHRLRVPFLDAERHLIEIVAT